jgi:hypothetical protein
VTIVETGYAHNDHFESSARSSQDGTSRVSCALRNPSMLMTPRNPPIRTGWHD